MQYGLYKKVLVLTIIFLFIGAGVFPNISGNMSNVSESELVGTALLDDHPEIEWQKTFGEKEEDGAGSVRQTTDGRYIINGGIKSYGTGNSDVWLIKPDSIGNKVVDKTFGGNSCYGDKWVVTYGGSNEDWGYSVKQTLDGSYVVVGGSMSFGSGDWDGCLLKINTNGKILFDKMLGGSYYDAFLSVEETNDEDYIIVGTTYSYGAGHSDLWLIKTDKAGKTIWQKTFGGIDYDEGFDVSITTDNGYIITGFTHSFGNAGGDVWLIKTDQDGNEIWNKTFGGKNFEKGYSVQQTTNGGFILSGGTYSFNSIKENVWLIKTDQDGNEIWNKTFGGSRCDESRSVQQTIDGGFILTGFTYSLSNHGEHAWLIKTDENGNEEWNKTFGGNKNDVGFDVKQTFDKGYIITGFTQTYSENINDVWLIKTDENGNEEWNKTYVGNERSRGYSAEQTTDGGYIIVGYNRFHKTKWGDIWIIKTDNKGNTEKNTHISKKKNDISFSNKFVKKIDHSQKLYHFILRRINSITNYRTSNSENILYVGGDGENNYSSINHAIDSANNGDIIFVYDDSSPYNENIVIDKSIKLIGENKETTIIDGSRSGDVITIIQNNVRISEFTIRNCGITSSGIDIKSSDNNILNNIFTKNHIGINLINDRNEIVGNQIINQDIGIKIKGRKNTVINNTITNSRSYGIHLNNGFENNIDGAKIGKNCYGIFIDGIIGGYNNHFFEIEIFNNDFGLFIEHSSFSLFENVYFIANNRHTVVHYSIFDSFINCSSDF